MPELPEVEIVRQSLDKKVKNKVIQKVFVKNRNLRFAIHSKFERHLYKKKIIKVDRFSKYLILIFEDKAGFIIHLGMSGTIHLHDMNKKNIFTNTSFYHSPIIPKKHNHVEIKFSKLKFIYNDPRRFGYFLTFNNKTELKKKFSHFGPEPFSKSFNIKYITNYFKKKEFVHCLEKKFTILEICHLLEKYHLKCMRSPLDKIDLASLQNLGRERRSTHPRLVQKTC